MAQSPELFYSKRLKEYRLQSARLQKTLTRLSVARLLLFVGFVYFIFRFTQIASSINIIAGIIAFIIFLITVKRYDVLKQQVVFYNALANYNANELQFLQTNKPIYDVGKEYEDIHHPFSYDLDLFANGGIFSYVNRCSTSFGKQALAQDFTMPDTAAIKERQVAIAELAEKIDFRQQLYAHGNLHESRKKDLQVLLAWIQKNTKNLPAWLYYLLMIFPLGTLTSLVIYCVGGHERAFSIFSTLFTVNLFIAFGFARKITSQLSVSTSVTRILRNYKNQLRLIENENFKAPLLKQYQQQLLGGGLASSKLIDQLASLFEYLETIVNLVVSILLNGLFLFHVHILYRLGNWKNSHAQKVEAWLQLIGKIESLNSFANLSYNNPSFCYPLISKELGLQATNMGHVLVNPAKRVCNNVSLQKEKFIILTGSNMSGKSTFLRTLGVNLVLAKCGSPVCATSFQFYPFDIFVSMRITDSLQESESLFYAELKRLQSIIRHLQHGNPTLVILDEILRGTNSNDKRNGTIGLIKKLATTQTFGIIATHDIVVAELIKQYPGYIANKAFESEIINDELLFDYKLKDGVCTTLSASYLMKKMEII